MIERYSRPAMKQIWSEENKFAKWLQVELAVCQAWAEEGVVPKGDIPKLQKASFNMERYGYYLKQTHHDVTAFLKAIGESLGEESRFIHFGLTSSDIMDTALSLQLIEAADILDKDIEALVQVLEARALEHRQTIMMGRTHGVHAEPITFGLKLALWREEMLRNRHRLGEARKTISVGKISGAVGTHATVPPSVEEKTCAALGLDVASITNQIIQRDRHAQFVTTLAIIASSLEKFATEIRALQKTEVREVEEPFEPGQTGSSAMPHKRNPELAERVCGLSRLLRGHAVTAMENIALWHERDISHSSTERIILPDSCLALDYAMDKFTYIMKGLRVYTGRMKQNLELSHGLIFSQRVLLALIEHGLDRQKAYAIVQRCAMQSWETGAAFYDLLAADVQVTSSLPPSELKLLFDYGYFVRYADEILGRVGLDNPTPRC